MICIRNCIDLFKILYSGYKTTYLSSPPTQQPHLALLFPEILAIEPIATFKLRGDNIEKIVSNWFIRITDGYLVSNFR
jgi:hypothetical protein